MPKMVLPMPAVTVARIKRPGLHAVGGAAGLYLLVTVTGSRRWVYRVMQAGRRSDLSLGPFPEVSLADARERALELRGQQRAGVDVAQARREAKRRERAERAAGITPGAPRQIPTFRDYATSWIDLNQARWKNEKHAQQWKNTLESYAYPKIGAVHVDLIETAHVLEVLQPIWLDKTETARRVMQRIKRVLDAAAVEKLRAGENPARWTDHLENILPPPAEIAPMVHHSSMPYQELPAFVAGLASRRGYSNQALLFLILTAARTQEVLLMERPQADMDDAVWEVPAEAMKMGRVHYVPLSWQAVALLDSVRPMAGSSLMFVGMRGKPMSNDTLMSALKKSGGKGYTVHGMRATFMTWAGDISEHTMDLADMALSHKVKGKVRQAYMRGDMFERRRVLMQQWADYCLSLVPSHVEWLKPRGSGQPSRS